MKLKYNELIFDVNGDVNLDNYYTKSECDNKYALKSHTHSNYATTSDLNTVRNTANNALNTANGKLANIDTNLHIQNTIGDIYTDADAYLNKNLHVRHNCIGTLKGTCSRFDQWLSITQNGQEIYRYTTGDRAGESGLCTTISLLFKTSDIFKMTTSSRDTTLTINAIGTNSNLYY